MLPIMITKHIREMAEKRGIKHAHALEKEIKVSPTVAAKLWKGDFEMIGLGTLDKLCRAFKCPVGSLLRYEEEHAPDSKRSR
jgi:DNA-binding Xre family transcriptional regulator